ncbi:MAG: S-layer homology domain-containing protein [Lachnospirales bacterium]
MKKIKFLSTIITLVLSVTLLLPSVQVFANSYSDVPTNHWAYKQIDYVTDAGYMSGNTEGAFELNQKIDPFEMAKIIARVAGFKTGVNATTADLSNQETIYEKHKTFISQYSSFSLWNTSANREIAYLLEKGILADTDLNKFVIKTETNTEKVVNPSREDLSYYLVKALGKESEAKALTSFTKFADDSSIAASRKSYVYYLRSKSVISGDSENKFNPNNNVTKAEMATILYNVDTKINGVNPDGTGTSTGTGTGTSTGTDTGTGTSTGTGTTSQLTVVTGTITDVNQAFKTFTIQGADNTSKSYVLKSTGSLFLNNETTTIDKLTKGMTVSCVIENNSGIVTLRAVSVSTPTTDTGTGTTTDTGTSTGTGTTTDTGSTTELVIPSDAKEVTGAIVSHNTGFDEASRTITLEVSSTSSSGKVTTSTVTYNVLNNANITHDGNKVLLGQLNPYDYATVLVSNNKVYSIESHTRFSQVSGVLVEKKYDSVDNYYLSVKDRTTEKITDYKVTTSTKYVRGGSSSSFDSIRIGDSITLSLDYNTVLTASATMTSKTTVKGIIKEIAINEHFGTITVATTVDSINAVSTTNTYTIKEADYDIYELKVGYQVTLTLESSEVTALSINDTVVKTPVSGVIESIDERENTFLLRTAYGYVTVATDFNKTVVVNASTGVTGYTDDLEKNQNVTVYWSTSTETASTIMIN